MCIRRAELREMLILRGTRDYHFTMA